MSQPSYSADSTARKDANRNSAVDSASAAPPNYEPGRHCAYNQARQRFLSADVDAGDWTGSGLVARLPSITPGTGAGLWLVPFRGIAPTGVRVPVDLIYLDINCRVVETVESFPLARVPASTAAPASVLVLPSDTVRFTETRAGDQILLCPPEEMKRHLQRLAVNTPEAAPAAGKEDPARGGAGRIIHWEDRARPRIAEKPQAETAAGSLENRVENRRVQDRRVVDRRVEGRRVEDRRVEDRRVEDRRVEDSRARRAAELAAKPVIEPIIQPAIPPVMQPVMETAGEPVVPFAGYEVVNNPANTFINDWVGEDVAALPLAAPAGLNAPMEAAQRPVEPAGWLKRMLGRAPRDARKARRESLQGLSAYFFTGGVPVAHRVRDISLTGMYVLTTERWYPGTMVRMTLTDRQEPTVERSITLHATVMRSGQDGVGLRFVLRGSKDRGRPANGMAEHADIAQLERFLGKLRSPAS